MTKTIASQCIEIDGDRLAETLQLAGEKLGSSEGDLTLDFSSVQAIDPAGLGAIQKLADTASGKNVKVSLRGVDVTIYKVLKLARLTSRFQFVS